MGAYCALVALAMLAMIGMAVFASFVKFWPYDLSFSLRHYAFGLVDGEVIECLE
jgi:iron(III) transport system permease protein